ncbi:MAG: beta-N-acetylglucosaminidase, partial [Flavobacteriaceae bacterium]|nr:beta-N-acetylglucosaminidase [Flavobacteriaceae bacterium]
MRIKSYFLFLFLLSAIFGQSQQNPLQAMDSVAQMKWVNDTYKGMTLEEKIGQLFMVLVASDQDKASTDKIKTLIAEEHLGGIIFSTGGPVRQAKLTNEYQALSKVPLMIGMDAEWGLAMRLDSTFAYPWNMTLGAIKDSNIIEEVGFRIGSHAKRLGVHFNFAPDVDININPRNPIIGNRSFGEDRENVARKGAAFVRGMSRAGVLSSGKHFPGHGDTAVDSHKDLPVIPFERERLDSIEMYPYKELIKAGVSGVMVAHLNVPALEPDEKRPSSLSSS